METRQLLPTGPNQDISHLYPNRMGGTGDSARPAGPLHQRKNKPN